MGMRFLVKLITMPRFQKRMFNCSCWIWKHIHANGYYWCVPLWVHVEIYFIEFLPVGYPSLYNYSVSIIFKEIVEVNI